MWVKKSLKINIENRTYVNSLYILQTQKLKKRKKYRILFGFSKLKAKSIKKAGIKKYIQMITYFKKLTAYVCLDRFLNLNFFLKMRQNKKYRSKILINFLLLPRLYQSNLQKIYEGALNQQKLILYGVEFKILYDKYKYVSKLRNIQYYSANWLEILINNWYKKYTYKEFIPIYWRISKLASKNLKILPIFNDIKIYNFAINLILHNIVKNRFWKNSKKSKKQLLGRYYKFIIIWNYAKFLIQNPHNIIKKPFFSKFRKFYSLVFINKIKNWCNYVLHQFYLILHKWYKSGNKILYQIKLKALIKKSKFNVISRNPTKQVKKWKQKHWKRWWSSRKDPFAWQRRYTVSKVNVEKKPSYKLKKNLLIYKIFRRRNYPVSNYNKLKKIIKKNFFLTKLGINYIYNIYTNNYFQMYNLKKKSMFKIPHWSNFPIGFEYLLALNSKILLIIWQVHSYLRLRLSDKNKPLIWKYWTYYFLKTLQYTNVYSKREKKNKIGVKKSYGFIKGYHKIRQIFMPKKGWFWIDKLVLKRNLYKQKYLYLKTAKRRLFKIYKNRKLPNWFSGNQFYKNLRRCGYDFRHPTKLKYRWKFKRSTILKSLRYFYGQLTYNKLLKIWKNVDRRTSIYNNRYDNFFSKLDNQLITQSYRLGYTFSSFWSNQFMKNGWISSNNPDHEDNILKNMNHVKKFTFPLLLWDPKNIYFKSYNKTYKYEKYKNLTLLPRRILNNKVIPGDIINIANVSSNIYGKFKSSKTLKYSLPISSNIMQGHIKEYLAQSKNIYPSLNTRENYCVSVILFNPKISDLNIIDRINTENIFFLIKSFVY